MPRFAANLSIPAADFFREHGINVGMEPINQRSMPSYFLRTLKQAAGYIGKRAQKKTTLTPNATKMLFGNLGATVLNISIAE
jgi:hydroxypyruvate isomerase